MIFNMMKVEQFLFLKFGVNSSDYHNYPVQCETNAKQAIQPAMV